MALVHLFCDLDHSIGSFGIQFYKNHGIDGLP